MTKQRRFTREFEDEAVRLARTSGRTRREMADDLGIGLSTLVRWIGRGRNRVMDAPTEPMSKKMLPPN
jgi:transposase